MECYEFRSIKTPVGPLYLAGDGHKVAMICFRKRDLHHLGGKLEENPTAYRQAVRELNQYFEGKKYDFTFPYMLFAEGFDRKVLDQLLRVKYGQTTTYKKLAGRAGSPRAYRAAGSACARNPLPIRIPCHRVLKSDGRIGGWSGLPGVKEKLLDLEQQPGRRKA
jgi:methylated-DNA-[protein]-cysteine S-methyltransferase